MATLGEVIRARRAELGLTQEELAARIGDTVRQAEVSRLEHDRVTLPRRDRLERIATALDLPVGELLASSGWVGAEDAFPLDQVPHPTTPAQPVAALTEVLAEAKEVVAHLEELVEAAEDPQSADAPLAPADQPQVAAE